MRVTRSSPASGAHDGGYVAVPLPTRRATQRLAALIATHVRAGDVLLLDGPLGVGKTFFARALFRALGVPSHIPITSPTFALIAMYPQARVPIVHGDFYRLESGADLETLGLEGAERSVTVLEWAKGVTRDGATLVLEFGRDPREVRVHAVNERCMQLVSMIRASAASPR